MKKDGIVDMEKEMKILWWKKYTLSIEEAAKYFRIGENKLRQLIKENTTAEWILWNGNRAQIKRNKFEQYIDGISYV